MDERQAIAAANDNDFHASRHRTLPILASVTPIANYPTKLRIFKTNASRYWQVRCFIKGRTYTQSLRTTNKQAAISAAKQFFHIKVADLYGEHVRDRGDEPRSIRMRALARTGGCATADHNRVDVVRSGGRQLS